MKLPRVTLVTPVLNGSRFLTETLASIRAQLYPNLEYIVCDGGSTDGTLEILQANSDIISRLIVEKDRGIYDALAKGFAHASGDIFSWIGSDDLLMPWCLRCVAQQMQLNQRWHWVTGIPNMLDAEGRMFWAKQVAPRYCRPLIRLRWYSWVGLGVIQQEGTFFSRVLYERAGGLSPCRQMKYAGDFDLWRRFARYADLHQLGIFVAGYRKHDRNLGGDEAACLREARAVRIPCGPSLGELYSLFALYWARLREKARFGRNAS